MAAIYSWLQSTEPPPPPGNCNEIWAIGTIVPDLHVAGVVGDVWNPGVIEGIGILDDTRIDTIYLTWVEGNYNSYSGSEIAQVFYPYCQWFNYAGPTLDNQFAASTCEFTDGGWNKQEDIIVVTDTHGIKATQVNWSSTATDNSATKLGTVWKGSAANSIGSGTDPMLYVGIFYKNPLAANWARLYWQKANASSAPIITLFNQVTGEIKIMSTSTGTGMDAQVRDAGDWWEIYLQVNNTVGGIPGLDMRGQIVMSPAYNTDGTEILDLTATGSLRMGESRAYYPMEIWQVYGGAFDPQIGAQPSSVIDPSGLFLDPANAWNIEGGIYLEWLPMYSDTNITRHVEIISLNGTAGFLYYHKDNKTLNVSDGTNTATVPMVFERETKYRLGLVFGDSLMRVGVDNVWGDEVPYDGSFPSINEFKLFRNQEAVNYYRELRGFQ